MSAIKVHLDPAEYATVLRYAAVLHVQPEDIAYAALDRLMMRAQDAEVRQAIVETRAWRADNLPLWADTERSVHAYEGSSDDQPQERLQF